MNRDAFQFSKLSTTVMVAAAALSVSSCNKATVQAGGVALSTSVLPIEGPCPPSDYPADFDQEIDQLGVVVTGPDVETPVEVRGPVGELSVPAVPVGLDRTIAVIGYAANAHAWRGLATGVEIFDPKDEPQQVEVLLTRVADMTCTRTPDVQSRAFQTATMLDDNRVLLVGGARESADASGSCGGAACQRLTAAPDASIYDPRNGTFTAVGPLSTRRMFHVAVKLADGRVVVAGGTSDAMVRPVSAAYPFPIVPTSPVTSIEVFDPASEGFVPVGQDTTARVFAAATTYGEGAIITGGIPSESNPHDLGNAMNSTTVCTGDPLVCSPGPQMLHRRAGHLMFRSEAGLVIVIGGSIDGSTQPNYYPEGLREGQSFVQATPTAMAASRNLFFSAGAHYVADRMLFAGGLIRDNNGSFTVAQTPDGGGPVYVYAIDSGPNGGIVSGRETGPQMQMLMPVWLASAATLLDEHRVFIAGGYQNMSFTLSDRISLYEQDFIRSGDPAQDFPVAPISLAGVELRLREPRGGTVAVQTTNGAVTLFGGEVPTGATTRATASTAEIYTDSVEPEGAF